MEGIPLEHKQEHQKVETGTAADKGKDKRTVFLGIFKAFSAAVIGSTVTLATVPHMDFFKNSGAVMSQNSSTTESAQQQDASLNIQQVSSQTSLADIIEQASKAIVGISNYKEHGNSLGQAFGQMQGNQQEGGTEVESGTGSGVIYEVTEDAAYIITNHHVIKNASTIKVTLSTGKVVDAELVGSDSLTDIAVLRISGSYDLTPLAFGDSSVLRAGDTVIAIGNPLGLDLSNTVTQGIVSAVDRTIEVSTPSGIWDMNVIQTDAAINPGNSGGALINTSGELVGINSMKIAIDNVEGLGFAIPGNEVSTIIKELRKNGKITRPYLGISMVNLADVPPFYRQSIPSDVKEGVVIAEIDKNGAAATSGLQVEDVITTIDKQKISNATDLRKYLYTDVSIGDTVTIKFYRQGELKEVKVTLSGEQNIKKIGE